MKYFNVVILFLISTGCQVAMGTIFDFGTDGTSIPVWDDFVTPITLPYSFNFAGSDYSDLYISDNGAVSFLNTGLLNKNSYPLSDQWIAPLGFNVAAGANIWYAHYSGVHSQLDKASADVNTFTGSGSFTAEFLTVVTWESVLDTLEEVNTFQVAITRSTSESYVIFLYDTLQVQSDVTIGISLGDGANRVLAWDGGSQPAACDSGETVTVRDLTQRSQTACGTDAGVLVVAVHDAANFITDPICTYEPQSGCTPEPNPHKVKRCGARRRRRRDVDDL